MELDKNPPPTESEIDNFLKNIDFKIPDGFLDFFTLANGADVSTEDEYIHLWPLTDMVQLNAGYGIAEFAPAYFIFGSDGAGTAYVIKKTTGEVYEMPFIGMSEDDTIFRSKTVVSFIESYVSIL